MIDVNAAAPSVEIYVLDIDNLDRIGIVDEYQSFYWHSEYNKIGSFELLVEMQYFLLLQEDRIIQNSNDRKHAGLIEYVEKITDETGHDTLMVKGRMIDVLIGRNIAVGEYVYESVEPADIIADLITKNAITPTDTERTVKNLEIGNLVRAREGVITYSGKNQKLSDIINDIAAMSGIGYNTRIDGDRIIFDTYLGENRTEEANTETNIETINITNMLTNGNFQSIVGWQVYGNAGTGTYYRPPPNEPTSIPPPGLSIYEGIVTKTKNYDRFWYPAETIWNLSPSMQQNVMLNQNNIYYMAIEAENNTDAIISFGIDGLMQTERTAWTRLEMLFVPDINGTHTFYAGDGDLPESENQIVRFRNAVVIDLTTTFGAGHEPPFDFVSRNIYYDNGWKYKRQIITLVPNMLDPLVLSRDRDNLISDTYVKDTTNEVTHLYAIGGGVATADTPAQDISVLIVADNATVRPRKEASLDLSNEIPRQSDGITIPESSYRIMIASRGKALIRQMVVSERVDAELYLLNNIIFGKDYYLGDLINFVTTFLDKNGTLERYSANLRIMSSSESWGVNEYSISLGIGDGVPDIHDFVKLVAKGAK